MLIRPVASVIVVLSVLQHLSAQSSPPVVRPSAEAPPAFAISFQQGEKISGLEVSPVVLLPVQCTSSGTIFLNLLQLPDFRNQLLESVSVAREVHQFHPQQVPDLYDVRVIDYFASDSGVSYLVQAAQENETVRQTVTTSSGESWDETRNPKDHHYYVLRFDRDGSYKGRARIDDQVPHFNFQRLGVFSSGTMLAYGFDAVTHQPQLVLLKQDGMLLTFVQVSGEALPASGFQLKQNREESATVAPVQILPEGPFLLVGQIASGKRSPSDKKYPLLEVSEAGAVRAIQPKIPVGSYISMLVASDSGIYARVAGADEGFIYQVSAEDGRILARFYEPKGTSFEACIHDNKFFAFDQPDASTLTPLVGSPKPLAVNVAPSVTDGDTRRSAQQP